MTSNWAGFLAKVRRALRAFETERTDSHAMWQLHAVITKDELDGGWIAECVDLPGCLAQGETKEEAVRNLSEAIGEVIAVRIEQQLPTIPAGDASEPQRVALCV